MSWTATHAGGTTTLTLDDGAANALRTDTFHALVRHLDELGPETSAVVLAGREEMFSPGLDLRALLESDLAGVRATIRAFADASLALWTHHRPTVCAATGHAVAGGTVLAMACDHTVAADGDYAWGLTETSIDMELPSFIMEIARANIRRDRLEDLLLPGQRLDPHGAVEAGMADEVVPLGDVLDRALEVAAARGALPARAYSANKARFRAAVASRVRDGLDDEVDGVTAHLG